MCCPFVCDSAPCLKSYRPWRVRAARPNRAPFASSASASLVAPAHMARVRRGAMSRPRRGARVSAKAAHEMNALLACTRVEAEDAVMTTHARPRTHTNIRAHTHTHARTHTHTHTKKYTHAHTHTQIHTHTYTHTHTRAAAEAAEGSEPWKLNVCSQRARGRSVESAKTFVVIMSLSCLPPYAPLHHPEFAGQTETSPPLSTLISRACSVPTWGPVVKTTWRSHFSLKMVSNQVSKASHCPASCATILKSATNSRSAT